MVFPILSGYASKRLPSAAVNYSITELGVLGLCVNISQFKHLLVKVNFDGTEDYLAFTYIMENKTEPASVIIK